MGRSVAGEIAQHGPTSLETHANENYVLLGHNAPSLLEEFRSLSEELKKVKARLQLSAEKHLEAAEKISVLQIQANHGREIRQRAQNDFLRRLTVEELEASGLEIDDNARTVGNATAHQGDAIVDRTYVRGQRESRLYTVCYGLSPEEFDSIQTNRDLVAFVNVRFIFWGQLRSSNFMRIAYNNITTDPTKVVASLQMEAVRAFAISYRTPQGQIKTTTFGAEFDREYARLGYLMDLDK